MRSRALESFRALLAKQPDLRMGDVMDRALGHRDMDAEQRWRSLGESGVEAVAEYLDERLAIMEEPEVTGTILLVDGNNVAWRMYHVAASMMPDESVVEHVRSAVRSLVGATRALATAYRCSHVAVAFDAGDGGRGDLWPAYKAGRPPHPEGTEGLVGACKAASRAAGMATLEVPGYEADDVIATLTGAAVARGLDVVISSNDKDLKQLVGPRVRVYDARAKALLGPDDVEAKFGVPPSLLGDYLALVGDSIDNVPGVPGIGPKTATDLLRKHGSLAGVLDAAPGAKGKRGKVLVEHADAARLARELVRLRDVPMTIGIEGMKFNS